MFQSKQALLVVVVWCCCMIGELGAIQSNSTCAMMPRDMRQVVCQCGKQLQLQCLFNIDIKEIDPADLDRTLNPIYFKDVSISRAENAYDPQDINQNFKAKRGDKMYLYFPNFSAFSSPYIRVTFVRFLFIPSFAFYDKSQLIVTPTPVDAGYNYNYNYIKPPGGDAAKKDEKEKETETMKAIPSLVFELHEVFDFGIDRFAFYNVQSDSLIIEGPFNEMNIHQDAFVNTKIDEITIGCYCLECETFQGDCRIKFNQKSSRETFPYTKNFLGEKSSSAATKRLKLFGIEFEDTAVWNLDQLPGIEGLEYLELSNMVSRPPRVEEFRSYSHQLDKLAELHLKNNGFKKLTKRLIGAFGNLRVLGLAHNAIERIDDNTFLNNLHLEEMTLDHNALKRLSKSFLSESLKNLKKLSVKSNQVGYINDYTFENLKQLRVLDLTRNKVRRLSDKTFAGLDSLEELLLSFNPLKDIDVNSFKYLAVHAPLKRLDLISNTESDWFVFDSSDVCLLSHLKCETQVYIDLNQRCNCFVKYLSEIATSVDERSQINGGDDSSTIVFNPCSENLSSKKQMNPHSLDLVNSFINYEYGHSEFNNGPSASADYAQQHFAETLNIKCPHLALQRCFNVTGEQHEDSCLYQKFIAKKTTTSGEKRAETSAPAAASAVPTSSRTTNDRHKLVNEKSNKVEAYNHMHHQNFDNPHRVSKNFILTDESGESSGSLSEKRSSSSADALASVSDFNSKFAYVVGALVCLAIVSITALLLSIYLVVRRNNISYHAAATYSKSDEH